MGPRRFELVVLEGSAKKHKITAYYAGEFEADAENPVAHATELLKDAAKAHRIPKDNVGLVVDTGSSAFRRLELPFSDKAKLEQVVKFEIESDLPQWNIDDVVVDFHVLSEVDHSTDLLVTAVPKQDIRASLKLCEKAGIEPLEVQLETSAMVNAATSANICGPEDAQLLVHVGDLATSVVVVDGGMVREMRVIHIGALTHEVALVAENNAESEEGEAPPQQQPVDPVEASRRVEQALKRIRREIGRTLSAAKTVHPIEAIFVCGSEMPGLIGEPIMDVPVYVLDCFDEDGGQPADGFGRLVAAYGAAVTQLGGGLMKPRLRREDLAFTGAWERVEFPLAVAAMLLAMLGAGFFFLEKQRVTKLEESARFWVNSSHNFLVGTERQPDRATMMPPPDDVVRFVKRFRPDKGETIDYAKPIEKALGDTLNLVKRHVKQVQEELGNSGGIRQPQSAFVASNLVLDVLRNNQSRWRTSIHKISGDYIESRNRKDDSLVEIKLTIVFYGANTTEATRNYEQFRQELAQQTAWFVRLDQKPTEPLSNGEGIIIEGLTIGVNVDGVTQSEAENDQANS